MNKIPYSDRKFLHYFLVAMFILIGGNYSQLVTAEKPASKKMQPSNQQDKNTKRSHADSLSQDDVKLFLDQIEIYGQIAKPQTVFIIPGTDPRVDGLKIDRHFFSHIFRPVERSALRRVRIKQGKDKDHILW